MKTVHLADKSQSYSHSSAEHFIGIMLLSDISADEADGLPNEHSQSHWADGWLRWHWSLVDYSCSTWHAYELYRTNDLYIVNQGLQGICVPVKMTNYNFQRKSKQT